MNRPGAEWFALAMTTTRRWSAEVRSEALGIYLADGAAAAAQRTGVPASTVRRWAHEAGQQTERARTTVEATQAAAMRWAERRAVMVEEMGHVAQEALAQTWEAIHAGNARDAKDLATTMAILIDKAELLSGGATSREKRVDPATLVAEARTRVLSLVPKQSSDVARLDDDEKQVVRTVIEGILLKHEARRWAAS